MQAGKAAVASRRRRSECVIFDAALTMHSFEKARKAHLILNEFIWMTSSRRRIQIQLPPESSTKDMQLAGEFPRSQ